MALAQTLLSDLVRRFYPYGSERTILFGPLRGYRYVVELGHGFSYALGKGSYNFEFLARHVREGMIVYDIGANRGQVSLFFSKVVGARGSVHAFEPAPIPFESLVRNVRLNALSNVHPWQMIVSNVNGEERFTFFPDDPTEGKLERLVRGDQVQARESFRVQCLTLDSFVQRGEPKPNILKIDVEGSAAAVLEGARQLIDAAQPSIYIELHNAEEQEAVRDGLQTRGYQCQTIDGQKVADPTTGWASPLWCWRE